MTDVTHATQAQLSATVQEYGLGPIMAQLSSNGEFIATLVPALIVVCAALLLVYSLGVHMQQRTVSGQRTRRWDSAAAFSRELMQGLPDGVTIRFAEQQRRASFGTAIGVAATHANAHAHYGSEMAAGELFAGEAEVDPAVLAASEASPPASNTWSHAA